MHQPPWQSGEVFCIPGPADTRRTRAELSSEQRPDVLWVAPGSIEGGELASVWAAAHDLSDLARVPGPWGAVLWSRVAKLILVATDPIGLQPVFWARDSSGGFVVGSWLEAVQRWPGVSNEIDYEGVLMDSGRDFWGPETLHRTRFKAIQRVPMGKALWIDPFGHTGLTEYWDPAASPGGRDDLSLSDSALRLRTAIDGAIRRLTPRTDRVAAHLSGGLDSSAVAARADDVLRESGLTLRAAFSWSPDETQQGPVENDERPFVRAVAEGRGITLHFVEADERGDWFYELDQDAYPQATHLHEKYILPTAKEMGVDVILSGWGGDELASSSGSRIPTYLARSRGLAVALRETHDFERSRPSGSRRGIGKLKTYASLVAVSMPQTTRWLTPASLRQSQRREEELNELIGEHYPTAAAVRREFQQTWAECRTHRDQQLSLLKGGQLQHRASAWYQTGRVFGIDYRYPLLDLDVVTAALDLPWTAYRREGRSRLAFRVAVEPWLPASVAWRPTKEDGALDSHPIKTPTHGALKRKRWQRLVEDAEYRFVTDLARLTFCRT